MKVNTFIVGAPKAGTTSLHHYLSQHDEACMSTIKEPNRFSSKEVSSLFYNALCVDDNEAYQNLFSEKKSIMGEASVSYLFYDKVPSRIKAYNPDAKIIIMLRNPVERAFSHYLMDCRLGFCSLTLEEILANPQKHTAYFQQYLEVGKYYSQVQRYLTTFGDKQVKIILYEDFKNNTQNEMSRLFAFLNIHSQSIDYSVQNPFLAPSNALIANLYKVDWIRKGMKYISPIKLVQSIKARFFSSQSKPELSDETQEKLKAYFKNDVIRLEKLLTIDLSRWKIN